MEILKVIVFPFYWLTVVILLVLAAVFSVYRFLVSQLAKIFHPDWVGIMCRRDSVVGNDNMLTKPLMTLSGLLILDNSPSLEDIREIFKNKMVLARKIDGETELCFPRFQQYYESWLGYMFWKWDNDFCIENHVRGFLEENEFTTEEEVVSFLAKLPSQPFSPKRSFWEVLYIKKYLPKQENSQNIGVDENINAENRISRKTSNNNNESNRRFKTAVIYRLHHGMADGYSLTKVLIHNLCGESIEKVIRPPVIQQKLSWTQKIAAVAYLIVQLPHLHTEMIVSGIDVNTWFKAEKDLTRVFNSSWTPKISKQDIKETCKIHGVSFSSVLMAGLAGGIRKYFQRSGMKEKIPLVVRAVIPLPWKGHTLEGLGNYWSCSIVPLPTAISSSSFRLREMENTIRCASTSPVVFANFHFPALIASFPNSISRILFNNVWATMILSNLPGPTTKIKLGKKFPVDETAFWIPTLRGNAGIGIAILSYVDTIRMSFNIDTAIITSRFQVDQLARYIQEEFKIMKSTPPITRNHSNIE